VLLIGQDGGEGQPGMVVDGDVEIFVAGAAGLLGAVSVEPMARLDDARQGLMSKWIRSPGRLCS
jgi:hypothetical protein